MVALASISLNLISEIIKFEPKVLFSIEASSKKQHQALEKRPDILHTVIEEVYDRSYRESDFTFCKAFLKSRYNPITLAAGEQCGPTHTFVGIPMTIMTRSGWLIDSLGVNGEPPFGSNGGGMTEINQGPYNAIRGHICRYTCNN